MNFADMIAEYEAELVYRACQAEGFDAALIEKVQAWHAPLGPTGLRRASQRWGGVLRPMPRRTGFAVFGAVRAPVAGTLAGSGPVGPGGTALRGPRGGEDHP